MSTNITLSVCLLLAIAVLAWINTTYQLINEVDHARAGIEVLQQQRWDLVPNLAATVERYAAHEATVLRELAEARRGALGSLASARPTEDALSRALVGLVSVVESYPALKADVGYRQLAAELSRLEDLIARSRHVLNDAVLRLRSRMSGFPGGLAARLSGWTPPPYFEAAPASREAPRIG
jgi:LemA protein